MSQFALEISRIVTLVIIGFSFVENLNAMAYIIRYLLGVQYILFHMSGIGLSLLGAWGSYHNHLPCLKAFALCSSLMALLVIIFRGTLLYLLMEVSLVALSLVQATIVQRNAYDGANSMTTRGGGIV